MELVNFKCKTCEAPLSELVAKSTNGLVTCPYCGNVWTVPKQDICPDALQFLHIGEHDLDTGKFDDAFAAYKKASELDPKEPEAYFGMALAEFKIQYLKDHVNNRVQPICYEVTNKKFTESDSYMRALINATPDQKTEYEKKGVEIDYILEEFYKLQQSGIDYDCFICVKVTDDKTKQVTEDSKDADYIYRLLQDKGYKPFFSERELRNVTGADYEARILYALSTSECMLVVCRDENYLQTPWVKNEYSRFLKLINDEEKESDSITIIFNGTPIEKLPGKNGKLQGINFALREADSKVVNFVDSHTPEAKAKREEKERRKAEEQQETAKRFKELQEQIKNVAGTSQRSAEATSGGNIANLLKRIHMFLEDANWEDANTYAEKVLDQDPENAEAYLGKLLAEFGVNRLDKLANASRPLYNSLNYQKAYRFGDEKLKNELSSANDSVINRIEQEENEKRLAAAERIRKAAEAAAEKERREAEAAAEKAAEAEKLRKKKLRKRLIVTLVIMIAAIGTLTGALIGIMGAVNDANLRGGVKYKLSQDKSYYIVSGVNKKTSECTILSTYKGKPVKEIGDSAFYISHFLTIDGNGVLRSVTIPEGITKIGRAAFWKCRNLETINLPSSITEIGESAFEYCDLLKSIMFEEDSQLTKIGYSAFDCCYSLEEITIPERVTSIGSKAFYFCNSLQRVIFKNVDGWSVSKDGNSPTSIDGNELSNPSTAAHYLTTIAQFMKNNYCDYTWTREQ